MGCSAAPGASFTTEASDVGFRSCCFGGVDDRSRRSWGGEWEEMDPRESDKATRRTSLGGDLGGR